MNIIRHKILTPLTALLLGLTVSSCSSRESVPESPFPGEAPTLGISLGLSAPTRAAGDPEFESGEDFENYLGIDADDYRIYFFDPDNRYVGTFVPDTKPSSMPDPVTDNGTDNYYFTFQGKLPTGVGTKFKLAVFANWGQYPSENDPTYHLEYGRTTIEDIVTSANAQFQYLRTPADGENWLGSSRTIPFYGVREYDLTQIDGVKNNIVNGKIVDGTFVNLETAALAIPLLRAMARVEVVVANPGASFAKVEMTKVNPTGFTAPYKNGDGWKFDYTDYFHGYIWDNDFVRGTHLPGGANSATPVASLPFKKVASASADAEGKFIPERWVAYVPEYRNIGVGDACTSIKVTLASPDGADMSADPVWNKEIYFATNGSAAGNATDAGRFDIERNNIYRFTVGMMTTGIDCSVDIQPYAECKLEMEFGLMRDERGDLKVIADADGNLPEYFNKFMESRKWPCEIGADGKETDKKLVPQTGDYYAIVLGEDGGMSNASVWLKDEDGDRVLTNFAESADNDECSTRQVIRFFGLTETRYNKDTHGERRIAHFPSHWSIVLDGQDRMVYKSPDNTTRYLVESWDDPDCWCITGTSEDGTKTVLTKADTTATGGLTSDTREVDSYVK